MAQKQIKAVTISRSLHINYIRRAPIGWAVWEPANQEPSSCVAAVGAHSWDRGPQRDSTAYCFVFDPKTRILETVYSHFHRILPKHNSIKPHRIAPFTRKMRSFTLKSRLSSKSSNISQSRFTSGSYPAGSGILLWIRDLLRIRDHTTEQCCRSKLFYLGSGSSNIFYLGSGSSRNKKPGWEKKNSQDTVLWQNDYRYNMTK